MYRSLSGIDPTHYTASSARCPKEIHTRNDRCLIGSCDWNNPFVSNNPGDSYAFDKFSKDQGRSRLRLLFYLRWFFLRHVAAWLSRLGTTDPSLMTNAVLVQLFCELANLRHLLGACPTTFNG